MYNLFDKQLVPNRLSCAMLRQIINKCVGHTSSVGEMFGELE